MSDREFDKFYTMNTHDLLIACGVPEVEAVKAQSIMDGLVMAGFLHSEKPGSGPAWYVRSMLCGLAKLREEFPVKAGDRVRVKRKHIPVMASTWARYGIEATTATFSEPGTVKSIEYNCVWGYWHATVMFDNEYWTMSSGPEKGILKPVSSKHTWAVSMKNLVLLTEEDEKEEEPVPKIRWRCICGKYRFTDEQIKSELLPGQTLACLTCHDIFERTMDGTITVHYPPPTALRDLMYDDSLAKDKEES
jgi:hypothetical protein